MRPIYYTLQGHTPVPLPEGIFSADFVFASDRRVAETILPSGRWVSTVFLGFDESDDDGGPPLVFETVVFPGLNKVGAMDRRHYATWDEAAAGHEEICAWWNDHNQPSEESCC